MRQRQQKRQCPKKDGLWIQCCNEKCQKWRFVTEYHDPLSVPEIWICSQNLDKNFSSCDIPEEKIDENLVESKYNVGSVVWAKVKGFPWWPGIIDDSPETQTFYELGGTTIPIKYHVAFFEEGKVECEWVKPENIIPFKADDRKIPLKKAKKVYAETDYKERLQKSLEMAKSAIAMDLPERLKNYSLSARLNQCKPTNSKVAISQNTEKKVSVVKKPKRNVGPIKYVAPNIDSKPKKKLLESTQNVQMSVDNSLIDLNADEINPQRWNYCSIQ